MKLIPSANLGRSLLVGTAMIALTCFGSGAVWADSAQGADGANGSDSYDLTAAGNGESGGRRLRAAAQRR